MRDVIFSSSILILAIMIIRALVKGKVPAKLQYALWLLAALRLMVPGTLGSSSISVLQLLQISIKTESDSVPSPNADTDADLQDIGSIVVDADAGISVYLNGDITKSTGENTGGNVPENTDMGATENNLGKTVADADVNANDGITVDTNDSTDVSFAWTWMTVIRGIWFLGIVITGGCILWYQIRFYRYLATGRKPMQGENKQYHGLKVYTVKGLPSPCLCGNKIYLSEELAEDESKLKHVLAHEYCHYRQLDSLWAVVRCILVSVYWFHPLVWAAAYASKQDSELACDEAAIALLGEKERYAYGRTLLSLVYEKVPKGTTVGPMLAMGSSEKSMRERIARIAKRPKALALAGGLVLAFAAVIAVITFTGTRQDETESVGLVIQDAETGTILAVADLTNMINDVEAWEEEKDKILEELKQARDGMVEAEEEVRKRAEELAIQEARSVQSSEAVISRLSSYDEMLLPVTGDGREGEIRELPAAVIRQPSALWEDYHSRGEDAIIEGLYLLASWNGREGQSMPQSVNDAVEDIISVYGLYTKEYGLRGVKIMVGDDTDKDVNNFDIPWSFLGVSQVHVFETAPDDAAPDGYPRTFAFKQLVPGSEEAYMNYGPEAYELYLCDRYDTGHIELSRVSEGNFVLQIQNRISCKMNREEQKVYVYDNGTLVGEVDASEFLATDPDSVKAVIDTNHIDFVLGSKVEAVRLNVPIALQIETENQKFITAFPSFPFICFPIDCGYFGPEREFTLGMAAVDTSYMASPISISIVSLPAQEPGLPVEE